MQEQKSKTLSIHRPGVIAALVALVAGVGVVSLLWSAAGAQNDRETTQRDDGHDHITVLDHEGRFTGPGEWPPRNKQADTELIREAVRDADPEVTARIAALRDDSRVAAALGERYSLIGTGNPLSLDPNAEKGALDLDRTQTVYFSLTNNQTVVVEALDGVVTDIETTAAADGQLSLTLEEDAQAIAIARAYWEDAGDKRIDQLQGYSIWAIRPGGRTYDVRMAYVSFHIDADSNPELITWVDLTNGEVAEGRVDR